MRLEINRSPSYCCWKLTFKVMQSLRFTKYCFAFTLKQGTIVLAVIELLITSIALFLLLLAAMNMQEIVSMAAAELQALQSSLSLEFGDKINLPLNYSNNENKMLNGQLLAAIIMTLIHVGVVLSIVHMLSSSMLLYGAIYEIPNFLLPWLSTVLLSVITGSFILVSLIFFPHPKCIVFEVGAVLIGIKFYEWLVVFNFYRDICYKTKFRDIETVYPSHHVENIIK